MTKATQRPRTRSVRTGIDTAPVHTESSRWHQEVRAAANTRLHAFVTTRSRADFPDRPETDQLAAVLHDYVDGGKYLRSAFVVAGWLAADGSRALDDKAGAAVLGAAASMELLHCFALLQDDVMDESPVRRGQPAAHVRFARWHQDHGLTGSAQRFGESAAVLASDLCLVWAEQLLRECRLPGEPVGRALRHYDLLRSELAVGQFCDVVNQTSRAPRLADVQTVARLKSGNYTVRRPLELGAMLAGAPASTIDALGRYGTAIGEAFQLRDDLLGVFGDPDVTGKPVGADLIAGKATCLVMLAHEHADPVLRRELARLATRPPGTTDVRRCVELLERGGARDRAEQLLAHRVDEGLAALADAALNPIPRDRLRYLADLCANRVR